MSANEQYISTFASLAIFTGVKVASLAYLARSKKNKSIGKVSRIVIYPIKSCAGISVESAYFSQGTVHSHGVHDRSYAIVPGKKGSALSMKSFPELALIQPELDPNRPGKITVTAPGMKTIKVEPESNTIPFLIGKKELVGQDCGQQVSDFLREILKKDDLHLVYYSENSRETKDNLEEFYNSGLTYVPLEALGNAVNTKICLSSKAPVLLLSEESVHELNNKISAGNIKHDGVPVDWRNFRPNIVVSGVAMGHEEDMWGTINAGDASMLATFPCKRCTMTTVNQDEGRFRNDGEPLKTLSAYRMNPSWKGNLFGVYCFILKEGEVSVDKGVTSIPRK